MAAATSGTEPRPCPAHSSQNTQCSTAICSAASRVRGGRSTRSWISAPGPMVSSRAPNRSSQERREPVPARSRRAGRTARTRPGRAGGPARGSPTAGWPGPSQGTIRRPGGSWTGPSRGAPSAGRSPRPIARPPCPGPAPALAGAVRPTIRTAADKRAPPRPRLLAGRVAGAAYRGDGRPARNTSPAHSAPPRSCGGRAGHSHGVLSAGGCHWVYSAYTPASR